MCRNNLKDFHFGPCQKSRAVPGVQSAGFVTCKYTHRERERAAQHDSGRLYTIGRLGLGSMKVV